MKSSLLGASAIIALIASLPASAETAGPKITYVPHSLAESIIKLGPWTLHEGDQFENRESDDHFRHGEEGDSRRRDRDEAFEHDASGIVPPKGTPPSTATGVPYASYCNASGERQVNHEFSVMQPYYFPFVRRNGDILEGFFDYRPRNEEEATVSAFSSDLGKSWHFTGEALRLNPFCPFDPTDPDNNNVSVNGVKTAYGSSSDNAGDNGLGHSFVLNVNGVQRIYHLDRANNHIDSDQLVVHTLPHSSVGSVVGLPEFGFQSPLAPAYPALEATAQHTSGLQNPDAILGAVPMGAATAVIYVGKTLNGDGGLPQCGNTPPFALTNLVNKKVRGANHDVISIRVATTTDGLNFADVGAADGLQDPTTTAFNDIRWLGSGSILRLANGHFGMFFGAGNCLDNDSDGFHFIGYAETNTPVNTPADLQSWHVVYGFDNPILSTDTVVDNSNPASPRPFPLNPPLVNVHGADALTASQVAPFTPPAPGFTTNFFSGRAYDPQVIRTDDETVTIVFAGYNTPQPSNNLGDYRTIGRFQLKFPEGYLSPF